MSETMVFCTTVSTIILLYSFAAEYACVRRMPHLAQPNMQKHPTPLVSLLIPARNEARNIPRLLDSLLKQTYKRYEIIVVDDNSKDATPEILARYAANHAHVRVVQGQPVPPGWTGKCYACQQAVAVAQGEWLLFLDADTTPQPTLIAALLTHAQQHQFDLLTIFPFLELQTFWERLILPPFQSLLHTVYPLERINHPNVQHDEVFANGQCILVRSKAYHAAGGHGSVRGEIVEDVMLARSIYKAGFRTGIAMGSQVLRVRMYTNGYEVLEGLTKNAVAGFQTASSRSAWGGVRQFLMALLPVCFLAWSIFLLFTRYDVLAWAIFLHALVVMVIACGYWRYLLRQIDVPSVYAILWPFGLLCYGMITLRSLWKIRSGRGVVWKGRTYAGV